MRGDAAGGRDGAWPSTDAETERGAQTESAAAFTFAAVDLTIPRVSKRKPPLEVVRVVRSKAVDEAAASLRTAVEQANAARAAAIAAAERATRTRDGERSTRDAEADELGRGASARDFAQLAAFEVGAEQRIAEAEARARASAAVARESTSVEDRARGSLVEARTALDVVERHQRAARTRADREADARQDEAAEEAFAARFRRPM